MLFNSTLNKEVVIMKIAYRFLFVCFDQHVFIWLWPVKQPVVEGKIVDGKGKPVSGVPCFFKQFNRLKVWNNSKPKPVQDGVFSFNGCCSFV